MSSETVEVIGAGLGRTGTSSLKKALISSKGESPRTASPTGSANDNGSLPSFKHNQIVPFDIEQSFNDDSVHSDDLNEIENSQKQAEHLKKFDTYLKEHFKDDESFLDLFMMMAPMAATGVIAKYEIFGEYRLFVDGTINTLALNPDWYKILFIDYDKKHGQDVFLSAMKWNAYASLPPYLYDRLGAFFNYIHHVYQKNGLATSMGWGTTILGTVIPIAFALNTGAYSAITLYSADSGFSNHTTEAKTLPPYLFSFYTIDAFLINSTFRNKLYHYFFVQRKDDDLTKHKRNYLIQKCDAVKSIIASMSNNELFELHQNIHDQSVHHTKYPFIHMLKHLMTYTTQKSGQHRRYSVHEPLHTTNTSISFTQMIKEKWPYILGTGLAMGGAYLSYLGCHTKMANLMHTHLTWKHHLPTFDFHKLGTDTFQSLSLTAYKAFQKATQHMDIYNGNQTDWCFQCLESVDFLSGNFNQNNTFFLKNCPGVPYSYTLISEPNDVGYSNDQCQMIFDFLNSNFAYYAGITTDDYYVATPLDPLTLTPTQHHIAMALAIIYAGMNAVLAAPATYDVVERIYDSFSNQPHTILPGKRHKIWNMITLTAAGSEALVRTAFAAAAAWYTLQDSDISDEWLWTIVGLTWLSTAMNYFIPLDNAYSKFPIQLAKGVKAVIDKTHLVTTYITKNGYITSSLNAMSRGYTTPHKIIPVNDLETTRHQKESASSPTIGQTLYTHLTASIMCDEYITKINTVSDTLNTAYSDMIHAIHQEIVIKK